MCIRDSITVCPVDTVNHIICGLTSTLSPFAIFGAASPVSTTTSLSSSQNPSVVGQAVTLTSQVSPSLVGTPTGTITFGDGGTTLGTAPLDGTASATLVIPSLSAGTHSINAQYSGDSYFAASTSGVLPQHVSFSKAQLSVTASGLAYSRVSKLWSGTVTTTNAGAASVTGPFQLVLTALPSGVTATNAAGTFSGSPYITAPSATSLSPGQAVTVTVQFNDPSMTKITFVPVVYSGAF